MANTISDDYILLGFVFCVMGLLSLIITNWNIPFFFVIGVIYFTFGLGIWKVPDFSQLKKDTKKILVNKPPVKSQSPKEDDIECEEETKE